MEAYQRAVLALLKFADRPHEAVALARHLLKDSQTESQYRALLAAVGAFAKDNESYFLRYDSSSVLISDELASKFDEWVGKIENGDQSLQWLIFRKPNEPRMRAAYEVLAGWVLKYLYQTEGAIPIFYSDGQARIWISSFVSSGDQLWKDFQIWFLGSHAEALKSNIETLLVVAPQRPIGSVQIPGNLFEPLSTALVQAIQKNVGLLQKFQLSVKRKWEQAKTDEMRKHVLCESKNAQEKPPFEIACNVSSRLTAAGQGTQSCIMCQSDNAIAGLGTKLILHESKKVWYDEPGRNLLGRGANPPICPECFFAAMISGFYPSEAYSVCELPVTSAYQTFLLAQQLSNVTASLGAMAIARSALLTVLPSRYFLVRLITGRGALPRETQLYLLLADYSSSFPSGEEAIRAYLEAAGAINYLSIHLDLLRILNLFRRGNVLPFHFEKKDAKVRGNDAIRLLKAGRPYSALYRLLYDPFQGAQKMKRRFGERDIFKSSNTLATFDRAVQQGARTLLGLLLKGGGGKMLIKDPELFYHDVKDLSDVLYDLLEPIAQADVNESRSKVSVVVRKYVDAIEKRFPQLDLVELQYMVAKAGDDAEKRRVQGETVYIKGKEGLHDALNGVDEKVSEMYCRYFRNGNAYIWREFIKEVSQRLLARLLLGVHAARPQ